MSETEQRLRAGMVGLADAVLARPAELADKAEARAGRLVRRRRARLAIGAAAVVTAVAVAVPVWALGRDAGSPPSQPTGSQGTPTTDARAAARCRALVHAPHSGYSRLLISRVATGAQLRDWLRIRNRGPYSPSQVDHVDPRARYAVCGVVDPNLAPPGPFPPGSKPSGVCLILPPVGAAIWDSAGSRASIRAMIATLP